MKKIIFNLFILAAVVMSLFLSFKQVTPYKSKNKINEVTDISMENIYEDTAKIASEIHAVGTEENYKVRDYIVNNLEKEGLNVEVKENKSEHKDKEYTVQNILAEIPGSSEEPANILITAHYDSTPNGPGAADDAVSAASILETVRTIKAGSEMKNNIWILVTDGEEEGCVGVKAFAENYEELVKSFDFIANYESRGNKGALIMFETSNQNLEVIKSYKKAVKNPLGFSFSQDVYNAMPNYTDFTTYKQMGMKGINFASIDGYDVYHNEKDTVENLSLGTMIDYGESVKSITDYYGNLDKDEFVKIDNDNEDAVYFPFFKGNLIVYSQKAVYFIMAVIVAAVIAGLVVAIKKNEVKLKKTICGSIAGVGAIAAAVLITIGILEVIKRIYGLKAKMFTIRRFAYQDIYACMIMAVTILVVSFFLYKLKNKINLINMIYSGMIIWCILLIPICIYAKGTAYIFQWPLLVCAVSSGIIVFLGEGKIKETGKTIILCLNIFIQVMIIMPVVYMVYTALTMGIIPLISAIIALESILLVPLFMMINLKSINY